MKNIQTSVRRYEQFLFACLLTESEETDKNKYTGGGWEARVGAGVHVNTGMLTYCIPTDASRVKPG